MAQRWMVIFSKCMCRFGTEDMRSIAFTDAHLVTSIVRAGTISATLAALALSSTAGSSRGWIEIGSREQSPPAASLIGRWGESRRLGDTLYLFRRDGSGAVRQSFRGRFRLYVRLGFTWSVRDDQLTLKYKNVRVTGPDPAIVARDKPGWSHVVGTGDVFHFSLTKPRGLELFLGQSLEYDLVPVR